MYDRLDAIMTTRRPPVLAHERFVPDHVSFAGHSLAARFERILRTNLRGAATSVSGLGSEDAATAAIRAALPGLPRRLKARSLLDAPYGDAGWIMDCVQGLDYVGVDIVPSPIAGSRSRSDGGARRSASSFRSPAACLSAGACSGRCAGRGSSAEGLRPLVLASNCTCPGCG